MDKKQLKEQFGLSETQLNRILVAQGKADIRPLKIEAKSEYSFGAIADTHLCSKEEKLRELHAFYRLCKERGVTDVYHAGDLVAGQGIYPGQEYELKTFGASNQVDYFVANYPKIPGITTSFITGNHDMAYMKLAGLDIGTVIAEKRPDMKYLGMLNGCVYLNGVKMIQLLHPDGGMPYAVSYRGQRIAEHIASGTKPRVLLLGHLHVNVAMLYRNMAIYQVGCFEGQTTLLLRKGIMPVIGGYLITLKIGKDSKQSIVGIVSEFVPFFK
ncbi:MAG: metallophosphoesterase [Chloroflexota bacterium]